MSAFPDTLIGSWANSPSQMMGHRYVSHASLLVALKHLYANSQSIGAQIAALDGAQIMTQAGAAHAQIMSQAEEALGSAQQSAELAHMASGAAVASSKTTTELYADAAGLNSKMDQILLELQSVSARIAAIEQKPAGCCSVQ
jgi:methyl-accepting chemotaxis protein